jgi:hypothetical protein
VTPGVRTTIGVNPHAHVHFTADDLREPCDGSFQTSVRFSHGGSNPLGDQELPPKKCPTALGASVPGGDQPSVRRIRLRNPRGRGAARVRISQATWLGEIHAGSEFDR